MGCDIHWIVERRAADGLWHMVDSKDRVFAQDRHDNAGRYDFSRPGYSIGQRDYELFGILSGVRGDPLKCGSLLTEGIPEDPSDATSVTEQEDLDAHSWGWADGATILGWRALGDATVNRWLDALEAYMAQGPLDEVIPAMRLHDDEWTFPDLAGIETGHERLARATLSQTLLDWKSDPSAWRMVFYYDN